MNRSWMRLADPDAASDEVRRDSQGLSAEEVRRARRIVRDGGVADTPQAARLVMTLAAQERRDDGSLVLSGALAAGVGTWAVVRLLTMAWNVETWVVVAAAALQVPGAISMVRSRRRLPAVERDNGVLAAAAEADAAEAITPPVAAMSLTGLLRRELPGLIVASVLSAISLTLISGKSLTIGRVLWMTLLWTVVMTSLVIYRAWRRAHPDTDEVS